MISIQIYSNIKKVKSKVGDRSRVEGATLFPGLVHFAFDSYLLMMSVKQGRIKYHFRVFGISGLVIEPLSSKSLANPLEYTYIQFILISIHHIAMYKNYDITLEIKRLFIISFFFIASTFFTSASDNGLSLEFRVTSSLFKSLQVSRTLLSTLTDLKNAVVSIVSILPLISNSSCFFPSLPHTNYNWYHRHPHY